MMQHTLPEGVSLGAGNGNLAFLRVERPQVAAEISLQGAQVLHWRPRGAEDVLFVSERSRWEPGKAIRGGIPVCFPWFRAKADDAQAPSHGFARTELWTLDRVTDVEGGGGVQASLSLVNTSNSERWWPFAFRLEHHITVGADRLRLELVTTNMGNRRIRFEEAQHSYFRVGDARRAQVDGLDGVEYLDNTRGNARELQKGPVLPIREMDFAYEGTGHPLLLRDGLTGRHLRITKEGSASTVVWNPWAEGAAKLADLGDGEWQRFLCVEAANILDSAVELGPGDRHAMVTELRPAV